MLSTLTTILQKQSLEDSCQFLLSDKLSRFTVGIDDAEHCVAEKKEEKLLLDKHFFACIQMTGKWLN